MEKIKIYTLFLIFMILTTGLRYFQIDVFNFKYCGEISPILTSVIFISLNKKDSFKMLSFNRFKYKPLLLPIFLITCVIGIDFIVQFKIQLIGQPVIDLSFLIKLLISSILFTVLVGGFEEIGWRGYLTSKIIQYKMPWNQLIVITSIIWSIWHLPTHFSKFENHLYIQYPFFITSCFELSIIMAYLRIRTNSVIPAILFHSLVAILYESFFKSTSKDMYFMTFPSIIMILLLLPVAIYYYKRGSKLYLDNYLKTELNIAIS
jgi:membrane protease YdiL (CAAX protease family)